MLELHADPSWIFRRVETIHIVDSHRIERHLTLDIDVDAIMQIADKSGIQTPAFQFIQTPGFQSEPSSGKDPVCGLYVPITTLDKNLLMDLDVRDGSGNALPVATADENSYAAQACMLATLNDDQREKLSRSLLRKLYDIAKSMPNEHDIAVLRSSQPPSMPDAWAVRDAAYTQTDREVWHACFDGNVNFRKYVARFTTRFSPLVRIPLEGPTCLVKFITEEVGAVGARIKRGGSVYKIDAPNVGKAGREHIRILAPKGTFIVSAALARPRMHPSNVTSLSGIPGLTDDRFSYRATPERATLYTSHKYPLETEHAALLSLRPLLGGFGWPSITSATISFLLLGMGSVGQLWKGFLDDAREHTEATVLLLLLASTGFAAYLAREGEHEIRSRMLLIPRIAVAGTGACTLVAATVITMGHFSSNEQAIVWMVGAAYCVLAIIFIAYVYIRTTIDFNATLRTSNQSFEQRMASYR